MKFEIALPSFDLTLLPHDARTPGTSRFEAAVREYFARRLGSLGETNVTFGDQRFTVECTARIGVESPEDEAIRLLNAGRLTEAVPLLEAVAAANPENVSASYNLGMALSDLGRLPDAIKYLDHAHVQRPDDSNIATALGVALQRSGDSEGALATLRQVVKRDPWNGYAQRNLAAVLAQAGDLIGAEQHLRKAVQLLPNDAPAHYGLADVLLRLDAATNGSEADDLLIRAIENGGDSPLADLARDARSRIAQETFRSKAVGDLRPDALMYCLGGLERFEKMTPQEVEGVFFEIAMLGMHGLDVNDPAQKYRLKSLSGTFSGLHLVSLMYVAGAQVHPEMDVGFDLRAEYEAAKEMHQPRKG